MASSELQDQASLYEVLAQPTPGPTPTGETSLTATKETMDNDTEETNDDDILNL